MLNSKNNIQKICISNIARQDIIHLQPYQSARIIDNNTYNKILLNANELPNNTIFNLKINTFNRYPEPQPIELLNNYSKYINININNILITRGADEGIELLMKVFCTSHDDYIMFFPPTYGMYKISAQILGIKYRIINNLQNQQLNLQKIKENLFNIKICYICNPNNPIGNLLQKEDLIQLLNITKNNTIIVIDEAYIDFCIKNTLVSLIKKYNNLVILRTLSKSFALAGIRCGFVIANIYIINLLRKVIAPYPVPQPVSDIAIQALQKKNINIMFNNIDILMNNKYWLIEHLKKISFVKYIYPSVTNYILVEFINAEYIFKYLYSKNIIVRSQNHEPQLKNCIRITIGSFDECKKLIFILNQLSL
ncbi:histidinol-phosphate transaminase [Enterobacteriaceae endosymbiont of Neohaemonia nigricornis]|uniref:histidinol-phosphate transaminase n=1 Tax=Enterobacteriaceae endosymbiont of Neohaemonia nigricornis TaxID=2675792 RepID=UPI001FECA32E|nr:histidinol-phosphate transaminase [Enterobacteriaceae endosymbiont of Neohaemonia nigricornis]